MKFAIVFAAVLAISSAQFPGFGQTRLPPYARPTLPPPAPPRTAPPSINVNRVVNNDQNANIIRYESDSSPDGSYVYNYETDNGISVQAQGTPRDFGGNPPIIPVVSQGSYSYISPEGVPVAISYTADENGFLASGDAIPTPPPIPEAIVKALEFLARNPPVQQKKK